MRWREARPDAGRKSFRRKRDAERFDLKVKDAKQTGTLAALDGGRETLDEYVEDTWAPIHAAALAAKTAGALRRPLRRAHLARARRLSLRELTPEVIGRWQADRLAAGAPLESIRKALTLLGGILQRASRPADRVNPQRLVRKAAPPATEEVRPLAPATVEAICARPEAARRDLRLPARLRRSPAAGGAGAALGARRRAHARRPRTEDATALARSRGRCGCSRRSRRTSASGDCYQDDRAMTCR